MAYTAVPLVAQNIFILKHKLHCTRCENKLKRLLSTVQGVEKLHIDSKRGTITVVGTVDPATIVTLLGNLGRKAEVLWEQILIPSSNQDDNKMKNKNNSNNNSDQNLQLVTKSNKNVLVDDQDMVPLMKQLCGGAIQGSKTIEVSCSKIIRVIVNGGEDDVNKNMEITIKDGVLHGPKITHSEGGEGLCNASASCCGCHGHGHGVINNNNNNNRNLHGNSSCCCCQIHAGYGYGFVPTGTPPPWPGGYYGTTPSAPPLGLPYDTSQYQQPSTSYPVTGYSYTSFLSDDNPAGGCNII